MNEEELEVVPYLLSLHLSKALRAMHKESKQEQKMTFNLDEIVGCVNNIDMFNSKC